MKKITWLLVSMLIPMILSAQQANKDVLNDAMVLKDNRSLLNKRTAPVNRQMQKNTPLLMGSKGPHRAQSEYAVTWDFEDENQLNEFTCFDQDRDNYNWYYHNNQGGESLIESVETHSGDGVICSMSYDKDKNIALTPDNWLISPEVVLGGTLTFYAMGQDKKNFA